ncbi:MAG TPA: FlgD immunoglobulin-like domain containing protein [bacterium]
MDPVQSVSQNNTQLFGGGGAIMGKEDFLKILIAQLRHQDPINPVQGEQFAAQLAQFSSLEQLQNMNGNLENAMELNLMLNRTINNTMATTFIGKTVKALGNTVALPEGGTATLNYELAVPASKTTITIRDQNGNVVRTIDVKEASSGMRQFEWDGKNDQGQTLPAGKYQFNVVAEDVNGNAVPTQTYIMGEIERVRYQNGDAILILRDMEVNLSDVLEISTSQE